MQRFCFTTEPLRVASVVVCRQVLPFQQMLINGGSDASRDQLHWWPVLSTHAICFHIIEDVRVDRCDRHPPVVVLENLLDTHRYSVCCVSIPLIGSLRKRIRFRGCFKDQRQRHGSPRLVSKMPRIRLSTSRLPMWSLA